jgi:hypothetical protein
LLTVRSKSDGKMYFRSSGQIYVDVIKARSWFDKVGIRTSGTRLEKISECVYGLLAGGTHNAEPLGPDNTEGDTYYALSDGAGFGLIAAQMSKLPSHSLPRGLLRDVLRGPLAASKEDPISSEARNKFVELELAAHFSLAGFPLLGFDDLKFEFDGLSYLVECKRPSHAGTLDDNMSKAYTQLQSKLDHSTDRGIVAVAVEKILGLERRIHPVTSPAALARSEAEAFRSMISKYQHAWVDPRVVGVMAIIRFLMRTPDPSVINSGYSLGLIKFASAGSLESTEEARLDRLAEILQSKFREAERQVG